MKWAAIAEELRDMLASDQAQAVKAAASVADRMNWRRITVTNADRLAEIMAAHGWPTAELVGDDAAQAAWLIAQHADTQLDIQRRAVQLLAEAVQAGMASARNLAFLEDRVAVNSGTEQRYGTQIASVDAAGEPIPWPIMDPDEMDERRSSVGIESFAEYVARHRPPSS